jgi:YYY domain-containing protein
MLRPGELATQRRGGTWTSVFSDGGLAVSDPTLLWLLALEGAALAVTPLTLALFRRLPDRGYLLAKPLGLLLLAYPVWLLASLKLTHFDQTVIAAALVTLLAAGGVVAGRTRRELFDFLKRNWRLVLFCEVLFLVAFFFLRELRLANPDLWEASRGGEKPMDMAYFTAVTRSTTLPPYDPWFAGGYINYYYLGHFLAAALTKLTTIPPEFAFNLAVPTFFSLTVAAAFSVCYNLAAVVQGRLRRRPGRRPIASWGAYVAGLLGVFFVALAGNLDGLDQLSERLSAVSGSHFETSLPLLGAVVNGIGGAWQVLFHGAGLAPFDFWRSSRMLPPTISITEFPYFSFLFADLHAHMMAIPFEVLTLGIALTLAVRPKGERGGREWALVALLALVVGSLRWLNSWDYPPFLLLALAAVAIGERRLEGGLVSVGVRLGGKAVMLIVLSFAFFLPFLDSYQTPFSGFDSAPEKTPLHQYLAHFGVLAAISAAWLVYLALRAVKATPLRRFWRPANAGEEMWLLAAAGCFAVLMLICAGLILEDRGFVAALLPALALVAYLGWRELRQRRPDGGARLFVLALIGLGLGLSIGVDLVVIKGDIVRMNTVFKFYLHTWTAFAVAASFAAWQLLFVVWPRAVFLRGWRVPRFAAVGGGLGLAGLALAAAVYPLFATPPRLNDRFAELPNTLDGMAYMRGAIYEDEGQPLRLAYDYEGIQWLRRNVQGTPAIVEGRTPLYRWGGRFSIYTGLPAVLGWDWHQVQQRGDLGYLVNERGNQVDQFYASPDVAQALSFLRRYDVEYVIVGEVERLYYTPEGLRKIEAGLDGALERVFENAGLTIYKVKGPGRPVVAGASP